MSLYRSKFLNCAAAFVVGSLVICTGANAQFDTCPSEHGGDCHVSTPGIPGCTDAVCCELVCETLPECCEIEWDVFCATWADAVCVCECGCPTAGDCFIANGSPFCDDGPCCTTICAIDPFCCDNDWDAICAGEALDLCNCLPGDAPANDDCVNAIDISEGVFAYTTLCSTADGPSLPGSPCDAKAGGVPGVGADVWYRYTASADGPVRIHTCDTDDYDTQVAVFDGCACPPDVATLIECSDDGAGCPGTGSEIIFEAIQGNCYLINIGGTFANTGDGTLVVEPLGPPSNDSCASAIVIGMNASLQFNNIEATVDGTPSPVCDFGGSTDIEGDVWYSFTSPVTGTMQVNLCASNFDTKVAVYEAGVCPPVSDPIACDDDGCGIQSLVEFEAQQGQEYLIRAGTRPGASGGVGRIAVTEFVICDSGDQVLLDQIGPDFTATAGQGTYASQDFDPANDDSDIAALDDFIVPAGPDVTLSCVDVVAGGFNGFDSTADITNFALHIYSSPAVAGMNLTGDVASLASVPVTLVDPFDAVNSNYIIHIDLAGIPGPAITLSPGTYWIAVIPSLDFAAGGGQSAIIGSAIDGSGNGPNGHQANPNGFFGFPDGFQQIDPPANLAYRIIAGGSNPCPWDLDGSGVVNTSDLLALFAQWGTAGPADFDGSGVVNTADLLILFANWGPCP